MKVGIQLYSLRDALAADFEGTLKKVAEIGYEYVELYGYYSDYCGKEIKNLLDRYGLKSVSVHQGPDFFENRGKDGFDFLKEFGVHYVVIPWYNKNELPGSDKWEDTKKRLISLSESARENGMEVLYHNHDFEFLKVGGECKYDIMFRELDGFINPQPDVCWVNYGGQNPAEYIRKYGDRINVVHLKDFNCSKLATGPVYSLVDKNGNAVKPASQEESEFYFTPLGQGRNDFDAIISACHDIGAEYVIVEQDSYKDIDPFDAVKISRDYLRDRFGL